MNEHHYYYATRHIRDVTICGEQYRLVRVIMYQDHDTYDKAFEEKNRFGTIPSAEGNDHRLLDLLPSSTEEGAMANRDLCCRITAIIRKHGGNYAKPECFAEIKALLDELKEEKQ